MADATDDAEGYELSDLFQKTAPLTDVAVDVYWEAAREAGLTFPEWVRTACDCMCSIQAQRKRETSQ